MANRIARGSALDNLSSTINQGQSVLLLYMRLIRLTKFVYGEGDAGRNMQQEIAAAFRERQFEKDRNIIEGYKNDGFMLADKLFNVAATKLLPDEYKQTEAYLKEQAERKQREDKEMKPEQIADPLFIRHFRPSHDYTRPMEQDMEEWKEVAATIERLNTDYWNSKLGRWQKQCESQQKAIRDRRLQALKEDGVLPEDAIRTPEEEEAYQATIITPGKAKRLARRKRARQDGKPLSQSLSYR